MAKSTSFLQSLLSRFLCHNFVLLGECVFCSYLMPKYLVFLYLFACLNIYFSFSLLVFTIIQFVFFQAIFHFVFHLHFSGGSYYFLSFHVVFLPLKYCPCIFTFLPLNPHICNLFFLQYQLFWPLFHRALLTQMVNLALLFLLCKYFLSSKFKFLQLLMQLYRFYKVFS